MAKRWSNYDLVIGMHPIPFKFQMAKRLIPHTLSCQCTGFLSAVTQYIFMLALVLKLRIFAQSKRICWSVLFTLKHQMETSLQY